MILIYIFVIFLSIAVTGCTEPDNPQMTAAVETDYGKLLGQIENDIRVGDMKRALTRIPENTDNVLILEKKLFILYKKGQMQEAIKLAHKLYDNYKSDYSVLILAKIQFIRGYFEEFEKYWRLLPEEKYDDELRNMLITRENMQTGQLREEQKKAQDLLSESSEHYRKREYIEAELKLKRLIRKYDVIYNKQNRSMLRDIYFLLGRTGLKMNNKDDAIYYFKKAHETENTHSDTLLELGDIFFARERYQMALSYYRKAFELSKDIRTYGNIGICLINLNMYDDALGILKEVYTKEPDNLNAIYNLFICYHYLDNTGKAVEFGEMLIEKAPENSEISKNARNLINIIKDGED